MHKHRWRVMVVCFLTFVIFFGGAAVKVGWPDFVRLVSPQALAFAPSVAPMVFVQGGTFIMGDDGRASTAPAHQVTVGGFYIGKYEVTCDEYDSFCEATGRWKPVGRGERSGNIPVSGVTWYDAVAYCNWRSERDGLEPAYIVEGKKVICDFAANGYRLPTEAEWEYAARGGNNSRGYKYSGSDDVDAVAWYKTNSGTNLGNRKLHPVGEKRSNELGLHDMSGNAWEWCWDWYDAKYYEQRQNDNPVGPLSGDIHVQRGGCAFWEEVYTRVVSRGYFYWGTERGYANYDLGFRIARTS